MPIFAACKHPFVMKFTDCKPGMVAFWDGEPVRIDSTHWDPYYGECVHITRYAAENPEQNGCATVKPGLLTDDAGLFASSGEVKAHIKGFLERGRGFLTDLGLRETDNWLSADTNTYNIAFDDDKMRKMPSDWFAKARGMEFHLSYGHIYTDLPTDRAHK